MAPNPIIIAGVVKGGVAVPVNGGKLPEGTPVEIVIRPADVPEEQRAELACWEKAGGEAWGTIDQWEREE